MLCLYVIAGPFQREEYILIAKTWKIKKYIEKMPKKSTVIPLPTMSLQHGFTYIHNGYKYCTYTSVIIASWKSDHLFCHILNTLWRY